MLLHELNDDVLLLIISHLASNCWSGTTDRLNLSLTCRTISRVARPTIPQHVSLGIPSRQLELFNRALDSNPAYGKGVAGFRRSRPSRGLPPLTCSQLCSFFLKIPNIRTIYSEVWSDEPWLVPIMLSAMIPARNTIRELGIHENVSTVQEILDLISLPRLRHLDVYHIEKFELPRGFAPDTKLYQTSELELLDLGGSQIGPRALTEIVLRCQGSLKELVCSVPVAPEQMEEFKQPTSIMLGCFSPRGIVSSLASAAQTLTRLELGTKGQKWWNHDGTRLDLSSFGALRYLDASASCFVAPLSLGVSRSGLYRLLPTSLEVLLLDFRYGIGIFYFVDGTAAGNEDRDCFVNEEMDPSSYEWISELAEHKQRNLPSLKKVRLSEERIGPSYCFEVEEWDQPPEVDWAFDEAGIELSVSVRC